MDQMKKYDNANAWHGLYDTALWKRLRYNQLEIMPLCAYCIDQGLTTEARIVDHIKPHKGDISIFYDQANLQSLCKKCHDSHKQRLEKSGIVKGSNILGDPIDKNSKWHN